MHIIYIQVFTTHFFVFQQEVKVKYTVFNIVNLCPQLAESSMVSSRM